MIRSSISPFLDVQSCIKNELTFRNRRHHKLRKEKRVKTNGQAWDVAPNFATPGDGMGDSGVDKFQTHPLSSTLIQVQNLTYPREVFLECVNTEVTHAVRTFS